MRTITFLTLVLIASQTQAAAPPPRISPERQRQIDEARQKFAEGMKAFQSRNLREAVENTQETLKILLAVYPESQFPDGHSYLAECLNAMGFFAYQVQQLPIAEDYFRRALTMQEKLYPTTRYPDGHPVLANSLNNLAGLYEAQGEYGKAEPLLRRALIMQEKLYPTDRYPEGHQNLAMSLNNLAMLHQKRREYGKAEPLFRRALAMRQKLYPVSHYPQGHPDLVRTLNNLAVLHQMRREYDKAGPLYQRALAMVEKLYPRSHYPDGHPDLAESLNNLASFHVFQEKNDEAEPLFRRALAMQEKLYPVSHYPQGHPDLVATLYNLATLYLKQGECGKAEPLFQRVLALQKKLYPASNFPDGHPELASSLQNLALLYEKQGEYAKAAPLYHRALAMNQKLYPTRLYPKGHPHLATTISNVAGLYAALEEYGKAESFYHRALAMQEKLYPSSECPDGHLELASCLSHLASLHAQQGEYVKAERLLHRALRMIEKLYPTSRYPEGHPLLATSLHNLAILLRSQGKYDQAKPLYRRALATYEKLFPPSRCPDGHPDLAQCLNNLAMLLESQEEYSKAEPLLRRALVMNERLYPKSRWPQGHPDLAESLNNLAYLHSSLGEHRKAEPLFRRALTMTEKLYPAARFPDGHPDLARSLINLATLHHNEGSYAKAESLYRRSLPMHFASAISVATSSDEATALNFVAQQPMTRDAYLSVTRHLSTVDAYPLIWQSKGALSRVIEQRHLAASATQSPKARELWEGMHRLRRERERLLLAPVTADKAKTKARDERLDAIDEEIRQLREKLLPLLPQLGQISELAKKTPADLQRVLPDDAALVDLLRYVRFEQDKKIKGKKGERRIPSYVAFVVTKQAVVRIELGEAKPIEETLSLWREAILEGSDAEPKYAVRLYEQLWRPLAKHLPNTIRQLYVSPDAALQRLPWPALRNGKTQRILLEDYRLAVVPHGPFLYDQLSRPAKPIERPRILVMGGVAYDDQPVKPTLLASRDLPGEGVKWNPLPGTKKELEQILALAGKRRIMKLEGNRASTSALLAELPKANVAHLATHGFFADPKFRTVFQLDPQLFGQLDRERATAGTRSPLILSGIVCAGANRDDTPNRGVVTAEALVALNLDHLNLAVLSACETGLGDVAGGEGVYGLTRALHVCGCRNVAASLWKVNDEATAALMVLFYRQLWDAETPIGPAEAMRQAQLALYRASPEQIQQWSIGRGPSPKPVKSSATSPSKAVPQTSNQAKVWAAFVVSGVGE